MGVECRVFLSSWKINEGQEVAHSVSAVGVTTIPKIKIFYKTGRYRKVSGKGHVESGKSTCRISSFDVLTLSTRHVGIPKSTRCLFGGKRKIAIICYNQLIIRYL